MARKPKKGKSLAEVNPELAKQWHLTKNGELTPLDVMPGSRCPVWWKCDNGEDHEWIVPVSRRKSGSGCPYCAGKYASKENNLAITYPNLLLEWNYKKNENISPELVLPKSNNPVWWVCRKGHEWEAVISSRTYGKGCPYCSGKYASKENNLVSKYPELVKEWDYKKNSINPDNFTPHSNEYAFWICNKNQNHKF